MARITRRSVLLGALAGFPSLPARKRHGHPASSRWWCRRPPVDRSTSSPAWYSPALQQRLGTPVIVENRSGAATSLGAAFVAKSPRDGSKWLLNADPQALNPSLLSSMPFDTEKDLDPVLLIGTSPNVLAAHPSKPYRALNDVSWRRASREGSSFSVIADTLALVSMVLLNKLAAAHLTPVTYRGPTRPSPMCSAAISIWSPAAQASCRHISRAGSCARSFRPD